MILLGDFPRPAAWTMPSKEAEAIVGRKFWTPNIPDFQAVSGSSRVVGTFVELLEEIERQPARSIDWICFISHGNLGNIGFAGHTDLQLQDVIFDETLVSGELINTPLAERVGKLRDRFAPDAWIDFYLCSSGSNVGLLREIANAFQVTVRGFRSKISYCFEVVSTGPTVTIDRRRVTLGSCNGSVKPSIFLLVPDSVANPSHTGSP